MLSRLLALLRMGLMCAGALVLLITFTPIVPWTVRLLTCRWTDADRDVLIVLSGPVASYPGTPPSLVAGESTYWRAVDAIYVWRHAHFRTMVLSGAGSAETIEPLLVANGVPQSAILVEDRATSTRENVLFTKRILAGLSGRFVLLTSDYHMFRASRCFSHERIPVETLPAPDLLKRCHTRVARWQAFWMVAEELVKIGYYRVRGWI
jgi:uncharacterized SAM-binding protein YcdF (DUF218 family)